MEEGNVLVRFGHDIDVGMVTSDWLKSFRDGYFNATVPNRVYYSQHHKILENLLEKSTVLVLCNANNPAQALGWMCYEVDANILIIHYIYVKEIFRRQGLATKLVKYVMDNKSLNVARNVVLTTHQTHKSKKITRGHRGDWRKQEPACGAWNDRHPEHVIDWIYNPYALFYRLPENWEKDE